MDASNPRNTRLVGLPANPRAQRQMLYPLDTSMSMGSAPSQHSQHSSYSSLPPPPYTPTEKPSRQVFIDPRVRNADSLIFANATIPLSPTSSTSSDSQSQSQPLNGLAPRKRNGFARLFCCFGREERARRRFARDNDYEKVGGDLHWSEY
ncbi:hypothetical protein K505DRAFT_320105 [Melanomma pulvis-pyrius CBS 109.77]|uniref:Uncharacterized protein n=1 Tax=Melanomma pulvis-pyrius CBS 109.77 TaxID=1314802 RepID=A0A6A6XWS5_9PLEO|nr:hypothetical protein K505DRAFT_320105 [Melanomma pulvis-pyrius CBS 109.77]